MSENGIYTDIAKRTRGEIYVGVVGPVRTGKSTFIKRFMETLVLPNIDGEYDRERARDELPQSSQGKTVMTTEPKFIPDEAVSVTLDNNAGFRVKMIDCVGFIVPEAMGTVENGQPRMVHTPWSDSPMPFNDAAELGTRKVITDHCTIAMLVTTDGTIGEIPRDNYIAAEEKTVKELKANGKPFVIILNSASPNTESSVELAYALEEKYSAPVALVNCLQLDGEDIRKILEMILLEFPVTELSFYLPGFIEALDATHPVRKSIDETVMLLSERAEKIKDAATVFAEMTDNENVTGAEISDIDLGTGKIKVNVSLDPELYYATLSELSGSSITSEGELFSAVKELSIIRKKYGKYAAAIEETEEKGYGIVTPELEDLKLQEPEIVRQPGGYGVKLRASAPSVHMIRVNTETEINPVVGTEQQSEDLVRFLLNEFEADPARLWTTNMFGKSLHELVNEGLNAKIGHIPENSRQKLGETLERIINEGAGGLICIIL